MMDYLPSEMSMENRCLSKISRELEIMNYNKGNTSPAPEIVKSTGVLEDKQQRNKRLIFSSIPEDIFYFDCMQEIDEMDKKRYVLKTPFVAELSFYLILAYWIIKNNLRIDGCLPYSISIELNNGELMENTVNIVLTKNNIDNSIILHFADIVDYLDLEITWFILWADPNTNTQKQKRRAISGKTRQNVLMRDNYTCQICGATVPDGAKLEIDHIKPVSKGGTNDENNLQVLCQQCNREKHNRDDLLHDKQKLIELEGK